LTSAKKTKKASVKKSKKAGAKRAKTATKKKVAPKKKVASKKRVASKKQEVSGKVRIQFEDAEGRAEALDASPLGKDLYRLDESPSFAYSVSLGDVVRAARSGRAGRLRFSEVVKKSGNRTVRLIFAKFSPGSKAAHPILEQIAGLGCRYDNSQASVLSVAVPETSSLSDVVGYLKTLGMWWEHADPTFEELYPAEG
jgi:hypothetical protein